MTDEQRLAELRELFLNAPESAATRLVAIATSVALAALVLWLVRRRTLRAEYTPIWMGVAFALLVIALNLDLLRVLTRLLGAWTLSSTIFFLGQFFLLAICLNYAVRLSQSGTQIRLLAQELALLRRQIEDLRKPGS
jgi:hypothetical protein